MAFFGVIMAEINLTLERSKTYKQFVDEIGEEFNLWLFKLDNVTKQRNMPPELFKSISKTVETMLSENYKLVFQDYPFYNQLTPRLQLEVNSYFYIYSYPIIFSLKYSRIFRHSLRIPKLNLKLKLLLLCNIESTYLL